MPQRGNQGGQDTKEQVFFVKPQNAGPKKPTTESGAARAVANGQATTEKKQHTVGNKHDAGPGARAIRLDEDSESTKVKTVSHSVSINIQKGRQAKGWNQKELAAAVNEKQSVMTDYESGKAVPNEQVLQRIEKALGMYLRGNKAGEPMEAKKTKAQKIAEAEEKTASSKKK
eukprot:103038_1